MKAALICTEMHSSMRSFNAGQPDCLLPLVDRPFVQQVVERLVGAGLDELHFVVSENDDALRSLLGDGGRWGVQFQFHEVTDRMRPFEALRHDELWGTGKLFLASANRLPQLDLSTVLAAEGSQWWRRSNGDWTGWALLERETFDAAPQFCTENELGDFLEAVGAPFSIPDRLASAVSFAELLDSQRRVLDGEFPGLFINGRQQDTAGLRYCRNAKMHASCEAHPPIFLGDNVRVGKGVVLGPNTVIGDNCIIDRNVLLQNSLVLPGTYVGEWLEINDCVVGPSRFVNARLEATVDVDDSLILCGA